MTALARLLGAFGATALLLLGCAAPGQPPAAPDPALAGAAAAAATPASPADWPVGLLPAVAEEMGKDDQWRPRATKNGAQATNTRHGLNARFDAQGLFLKTDKGEIRLAFAGIGRDGKLTTPKNAKAEVEGARVLYRHGPNLTQWFINSPFGLEQGFTLEQKPEGQGELRLALNLAGDLKPRLDNNELLFADTVGTAQLRYGALVAFDANGKVLPARMALEGAQLVLAVDDTAARYPVVIDPLFSAQSKLAVSGPYVALDGNTALIGSTSANSSKGAAYVLVRNNGVWSLQATLMASDAAPGKGFGSSVAVKGDTAVIGAPFGAGAAYVFVRNNGVWSQQEKLTTSDDVYDAMLGSDVAVSGDTILVGAKQAWPNGEILAGAAYVFVRTGTSWGQQAKLFVSDTANFGTSLALEGDTAVIGARYLIVNPDNSWARVGAGYVFVRSAGVWSQQARLTASDGQDDGGAGDQFGWSGIALSGDTVVIGAEYHCTSCPYGYEGAAYVFVRSNGSWSQQAKLMASDAATYDHFGYAVALNGDTALIGTNTFNKLGAAYVFTRNNGLWTQQTKLTASDGVSGDYFGCSVAVGGTTAMIGACSNSAVYRFDSTVDLSLVKQDSVDPVSQNGTFDYSLYVTNRDPQVDATNVTLSDTLPAGMSYVADTGGCTVSGATVTCPLGTLGRGGGMAGVHLTVRANSTPDSVITNTATASADQPDANPADNTDSEQTTIGNNTAPVAHNATFGVYLGNPVSGTLPASDVDNNALTFSIVSNGTQGTAAVTNSATGAFTYTPNAGASGTDTFTFKANDGTSDSNVATVTLTIQNSAPVASSLAMTTYQATAISGTLAASDANGDSLAFSVVSNGAKGTAVITNPATGAFTYTPNAGQTGTDTFTFQAHDGTTDSNTAAVTVTILATPVPGNVAPVANDLALVAYAEAAVSGTLPAADANGDALTFAIVSNGAKGAAVIADAATGAFTYTPTVGASGPDTFTFQATDAHGLGSNAATVTVTIHAVPLPANAAPMASDLALVAYPGSPVSGTLPASDANADTLLVTLVASPTKGSVVITNPVTGAFTYTPSAGATGADSFTFKATDSHGLDSTTATVTITIHPLPAPGNVAPVANNLTLATYEGIAITSRLPAADANGDTMTFGIVANGGKGIAVVTDPATGAFTYTPTAGETGTDTFTFRATDSHGLTSSIATVTVTIHPLPGPTNTAPFAGDLALTVYEGGAIAGTLPVSDANGDAILISLVVGPTKGSAVITNSATGAFSYTPAADETGTDGFTFRAIDRHGFVSNIGKVTITINPTPAPANVAPVASDMLHLVIFNNYTMMKGALAASDANGDGLTFEIVTNGAKGAAVITDAATGAFTYHSSVSGGNPVVTDMFTFRVRDSHGAVSNTASVYVDIVALGNPPPDYPPLAIDSTAVAHAGTAVTGVLPATDVKGTPLTYSLVTNGTNGTAVLTDAAKGTFTYLAPVGQVGIDTFTFKVSDGTSYSSIATVTVTLLPPLGTLAPVAGDLALVAYAGSTVSGMLPASDADGNPLTFALVSSVTKGVATIDVATGAFSYAPNAGHYGADTFTFRATDSNGVVSNTATVTIVTMTPPPAEANVAPVAGNLAFAVNEGNSISSQLSAADANGNSLTFSLVTNGTKGTATITDAATGAFTYTPRAGETGTDTFSFKASDGLLDSNVATITVTINPLPAPGNAAPIASGASLVTYTGSAVSGTLAAADANGDAVTFSIVTNGTKGVAAITDTVIGAFTYTPTPGQAGTDSFAFQATDSHGVVSNTATVTVTIHPLPTPDNVAPFAADLALVAYPGRALSGALPAADANNDPIVFRLVTGGAKGTVIVTDAASGAFSYTPDAGASGTDAFSFQATDSHGAVSNTATVTVTLLPPAPPGNSAPVANGLTLVAYEGSAISGVLSAADANGDAMTFALATNGGKGTAVITDAATGAFTYTPAAGQTGTDTFTFQANDGTLNSSTATVSITILAVPVAGNTAPVASDLALIAYADSPISGTLAAADANGDGMTFSLVANSTKGTAVITDPATGAFAYTANAGASGTDTFTFQASDGTLNSNTATVRITLLAAPASEQPTAQRTGGGGALSPLALLLGLTAAVHIRRRRQAAG